MSVINNVLLAVVEMMQDTEPYSTITIGAMPADNGIACAIANGNPVATFMPKSMSYELNIVLNGKHANQQTVSDALNDIHQALTMTKQYPASEEWQINNIETVSSPAYIGREETKQYLFGSSLRVRFYYKK